jgi:5'-nucleotidase
LKLILTNDDGIDAPGINALETVIRNYGDLFVVAPAEPNSGIGHRVTTDAPIKIKSMESGRYRINGTPADCVRIALTHLSLDADWVIAGINRGGNLGADVYMSGTVAAAREAAFLGCRSIAVSHYVAKNREVDWNLAAKRIAPLLRSLLDRELPHGHFWNVNLPHPKEDHTDIETIFCPLDTEPHGVKYETNGNHLMYTGEYHTRPRQPGRDVDVCFRGNIAVTQIPLDVTGENIQLITGEKKNGI